MAVRFAYRGFARLICIPTNINSLQDVLINSSRQWVGTCSSLFRQQGQQQHVVLQVGRCAVCWMPSSPVRLTAPVRSYTHQQSQRIDQAQACDGSEQDQQRLPVRSNCSLSGLPWLLNHQHDSRRGFWSSRSSSSTIGDCAGPDKGNGSSGPEGNSRSSFTHGIKPSSEPPMSEMQQPSMFSQRWPAMNSGSSSSSSSASSAAGSNPDLHDEDTEQSFDSSGDFDEQGVSSFNTEGSSGGLRLRFRRKTPLFQVIEFYASGAAVEEYKPRTPQELGLHPRDVTLFAPLSRLAAPQRATIAVHDGKILVKTEIVKAIITPEKAVLIKSRRQRDTQKLAQAILAANDQRLMALRVHQQQQDEQSVSSISPGLGSCDRALSAADVLRAAGAKRGGGSSGGGGGGGGSSAARMAGAGFVQQGGSSTGRFGVYNDSGFASGSRDYSRVLQPAAVAAGAEALNRAAGAGGGSGSGSSDLKDVPFEMLVLEVLLDATAEYFYTKVQHLNWMLESIAADIRQPGQPINTMDKAHQLIPIQKFLTRVKADVKETCEAIQTALEDDETLDELCLSWHQQQRQHTRWMPVELQRHRAAQADAAYQFNASGGGSGRGNNGGNHSYSYSTINSPSAARAGAPAVGPQQQVRMLTEMLESYEREIQSLEGSINEAEEDLENTRSIWHMQLDSSRNHIIMVNLWLSMLSISVMAATILPAFFGMNLTSGLSEQDPIHFYTVCGLSVLLAGLSYPLSRYWYSRNWRKVNQNELFEQKMLRVLLVQNIEDVDEIIRALQRYRHTRLDRKAFRQLVVETLGNRAMTPAHIDFLYQAFDRNRDGFIQEAEMIRPLNTYHHASAGDNETGNGASSFYAPSEYVHQQEMAGLVPSQLGSMDGRHGFDASGARHAVRSSPKQQKQQQQGKGRGGGGGGGPGQGQQQQQQKSENSSWMDDERFNWD